MDLLELGRQISPWATIGSASLALISIYVATRSVRIVSRTNKAKFVYDLTESFLKEPDLKEFWYRLDYDKDNAKSWKFDLASFRHSKDERLLDTLLYKFCVVGGMVRTGAISCWDVQGLFVMCRQTFKNEQVREYLRFHVLDFWCAEGINAQNFADGLYLYRKVVFTLVRKRRAHKKEYKECLAFIRELHSIPRNRALQLEISRRIGYDMPKPEVSHAVQADPTAAAGLSTGHPAE